MKTRTLPSGEPRIQLVHPVGDEKGTLARTVYERLKLDIFEFRMPPGQRYSEHTLAQSLGVSRTPLRFALHVLAHEGFLNHVGGHSSWQVRPLDLAYYEDLYNFRIDIEGLALRKICMLDPMPDLSELCAFWSVEVDQRVMDGHVVAQQDEHFHRELVRLSGNREMLRVFDDLTERIRIIRRLDFVSPARIATAYEEHREILRVLRGRKPAQADLLMRAHIEASRVEIRHITLHRMALATQSSPTRPAQSVP